MNADEAAPALGVAACAAVVLALGLPYLLITDAGTGFVVYYGAGPFGGGVVGFLAALTAVVLLAGVRGSADPPTAAGLALVLGAATVLLGLAWALAVPEDTVYSFPAAWMGWHRWAVVALAGAAAAGTAGYARTALRR